MGGKSIVGQRGEITGLRSPSLSVGIGEGVPMAPGPGCAIWILSRGEVQQSQMVTGEAVSGLGGGSMNCEWVNWGSRTARSRSLGRSRPRNAGGGGIRNPRALGCSQF